MSDHNSSGVPDGDGTEQPFISHIMELRDRLLRIVLVVLGVFFCLFFVANDLYTVVAQPLLAKLMPAGGTMIATEVASPFLAPVKLTMVVSVFIAVPFILYQMWAFVAPGLYAHERRLVVPLLFSSTVLFYTGMAFAYFLVLPMVFGFFTSIAPEGVAVMTDIGKYLDFVLTIFFAFGVAFEVPIATILLVWTGMATPESLTEKRPYIIVGAFVIGAVLTPPDVFSQVALAVPVWLLFEVGVFFSRFFIKDEADDAGDPDELASDEAMERLLDRYARDEKLLRQEVGNMSGDAGDGEGKA